VYVYTKILLGITCAKVKYTEVGQSNSIDNAIYVIVNHDGNSDSNNITIAIVIISSDLL